MTQLHGGNIYAASIKYRIPNNKIIDFSANINPLGFPSYAKKILLKNFAPAVNYPDPDCLNIKESLSKYTGISRSNMLIGNGSIEIIYLIARLFKNPRALILGPTFSEYENAIKVNNGAVKYLLAEEKSNFRFDFSSMGRRIKEMDVIFICNPNNPTGTLFSKDEIKKVIAKTPKKTLIVIDEAFIDFVNSPDKFSFINDAAQSGNILVIRSFTKFFSMAGLRMGFAVGNKSLLDKLNALRYPWSVNAIAQLLAPILIDDKNFTGRSASFMKKERAYLYRRLMDIKALKVFEPSSNFILCKIENKKLNAAKLAKTLGKKGILVRDCGNFYGLNNKFFRVAVKKRKDNLKLLESLKWLNR